MRSVDATDPHLQLLGPELHDCLGVAAGANDGGRIGIRGGGSAGIPDRHPRKPQRGQADTNGGQNGYRSSIKVMEEFQRHRYYPRQHQQRRGYSAIFPLWMAAGI